MYKAFPKAALFTAKRDTLLLTNGPAEKPILEKN